MHIEGLQGVPVVRRDEHHERHRVNPDFLDDLEAGRPSQLNIEEHDVWPPLDDGGDGLVAFAALTDARHAGKFPPAHLTLIIK